MPTHSLQPAQHTTFYVVTLPVHSRKVAACLLLVVASIDAVAAVCNIETVGDFDAPAVCASPLATAIVSVAIVLVPTVLAVVAELVVHTPAAAGKSFSIPPWSLRSVGVVAFGTGVAVHLRPRLSPSHRPRSTPGSGYVGLACGRTRTRARHAPDQDSHASDRARCTHGGARGRPPHPRLRIHHSLRTGHPHPHPRSTHVPHHCGNRTSFTLITPASEEKKPARKGNRQEKDPTNLYQQV